MTQARITDVELRRPDLRVPFPPRFRNRLRGQTVVALTRRAKYLLATLTSTETLLMHLGMSGSFHIATRGAGRRSRGEGAEDHIPPAPPDRHDHVVFHMATGTIITFNDPRRFGLMELQTQSQLARHPVLSRLGPEPLSPAFDAASLARACKGKSTPLKVALLDQRVVAGLGNIYASEALHAARLSPRRRAATIATPSGAPREAACLLTAAIKHVLERAIVRTTATTYRSGRFRVYDREGQPCLRRNCSGTVKRRTQAGRSTFYCSTCQR
jgi:formamidopyrimidine-DNA glycosylase